MKNKTNEIVTYGDYVKSLSNEDLSQWIFDNIIRPRWKGTKYWTELFNQEVDKDKITPVKPKKCYDKNFGADADGSRGIYVEWYECPTCGSGIENISYNTCSECGQVLDLEEDNE